MAGPTRRRGPAAFQKAPTVARCISHRVLFRSFPAAVRPLEILLVLLAGGLRALLITLGVDGLGEGVLELDGDEVHGQDVQRQKEAGGLAVQEGSAEEAHGRAIVHRGVGDVEGEARHDAVHEDPEVVAQVGAGDAQLVGGRDDEDVADGQEGIGDVLGQVRLEGWVRGLVAQGALIEVVAEEAEREDGDGEGVACQLAVAPEEAGEELGAVFWEVLGYYWLAERWWVHLGMRTSASNDAGRRKSARENYSRQSPANLLPEGRVKGNRHSRDCCGQHGLA
ncbi:hypothetical protein VTJ49DRAFT_5714 [Mycothermus thermophilus]|uniref:Uncharacterized protein n=1 Tax=Humicola insolens TaxID=85995 RepID=A0ABR3VMW9_HUMIN